MVKAFCVSAALLASTAMATGARADLLLGVNAVQNGGAEAGTASSPNGETVPIPDWNTSDPAGGMTVVSYSDGDGFPGPTDPGPADRGQNFFSGGPNGGSSITETVDVGSVAAAAVASGGLGYDLSGYLGGYAGQDDNDVFSVAFLGAGGASLGSAAIGPVLAADRDGQTGMLERSVEGTVPVGTEQLLFTLTANRTFGYNDGYADNLSFVAGGPAVDVPEPGLVVMASGLALLVSLGMARRRRLFTGLGSAAAG